MNCKVVVTPKQIENCIERNSKSFLEFFFISSNTIVAVRKKEDRITFKGLFFIASGHIKDIEDKVEITLKVDYIMSLKILIAFVILLLSGFLIAENVTINGNPNPSYLVRIGFISIFLFFLVVGYYILSALKKEFQKKILTELRKE